MNNEKLNPVPAQDIPLNNKDLLPIFFFQSGNNISLFFDKILREAELTNGRENLFILTDANFDLYKGYNCIDISKYRYSTVGFDKVYQHHSTNKFAFEKACFDRWFIIKAVAVELGFDHFFHADCDVLILDNIKSIHQHYIEGKHNGTMMYFENGMGNSITSGHSSFWNGKLINDFCDFVCAKFSNQPELESLLKDTRDGKFYDNYNLSDMILLDVFRTETRPAIFNLLKLEEDNICFDFNLNASFNGCKYNYVMRPDYKIKRMYRRKDGLYGRTIEDASVYRKFHTLHFQGFLTKTLIPAHVTTSSFGESLANNFTARKNFSIRKMKLLKNKVRDGLKKLIGKK